MAKTEQIKAVKDIRNTVDTAIAFHKPYFWFPQTNNGIEAAYGHKKN